MAYLKIDNIEKIEKKCFNQNTTEYDLTMSEALRRFMSVFNRHPKLAFQFISEPEQFLKTV